MSLQYGFNLYGARQVGMGSEAQWATKYSAFGENEKDYYHNVLPWALMMVGVSHVSPTTIPVIRFRLEKTVGGDSFVPSRDGKKLSPQEFEQFLSMYVGFQTNVSMLTDREWAKRFLPKDWDKAVSIKTQKQIDNERGRMAAILGLGLGKVS